MNLPLKADVYCTDAFGGTTSHVVLKPKSDEVTHIVVRMSARENSQRLVPILYLVSSTEHTIQLGCDLAHLEAMPHFSVTTMVGGTLPIFFSSGVYESAPVIALYPFAMHPTSTEQIPDGEEMIGDHAQGKVVNGHIGRVRSLLLDLKSHRISNIVLQEGVLWGRKMVAVPMEAIDFFDEDAVYLKWDRQRLAHLPPMQQEAMAR